MIQSKFGDVIISQVHSRAEMLKLENLWLRISNSNALGTQCLSKVTKVNVIGCGADSGKLESPCFA